MVSYTYFDMVLHVKCSVCVFACFGQHLNRGQKLRVSTKLAVRLEYSMYFYMNCYFDLMRFGWCYGATVGHWTVIKVGYLTPSQVYAT